MKGMLIISLNCYRRVRWKTRKTEMLQKARWSEGNSNGQVRQESRQEPDEPEGLETREQCTAHAVIRASYAMIISAVYHIKSTCAVNPTWIQTKSTRCDGILVAVAGSTEERCQATSSGITSEACRACSGFFVNCVDRLENWSAQSAHRGRRT